MVPVNSGTYSALLGTSTATSIAMPLPRPILNSHSRADSPEPCSVGNCHELEVLGDCHEGPTTRSSTVKPGHQSIDGECAREEEERQGRHRGTERYCLFRAKSTGPKIGINYYWILDPRGVPAACPLHCTPLVRFVGACGHACVSLEQAVSLTRFWTLFSITKARTGTPGGVLDSDKKAPYG